MAEADWLNGPFFLKFVYHIPEVCNWSFTSQILATPKHPQIFVGFGFESSDQKLAITLASIAGAHGSEKPKRRAGHGEVFNYMDITCIHMYYAEYHRMLICLYLSNILYIYT